MSNKTYHTVNTMDKRNSIRIGLVGCVSCGKSTLLNAICVNQYEEMKKCRTTMLPSIYRETNKTIYNNKEEKKKILDKNKENNQKILRNNDILNIGGAEPVKLFRFIDIIEDYLGKIAKEHDIFIHEIKLWNNLKRCTCIYE